MILGVLSLVAGSALVSLLFYRLARANPQTVLLRFGKEQTTPKFSNVLGALGTGLAGGGAFEISDHLTHGWQGDAMLILLMLAVVAPALTMSWLHDRRVKNTPSNLP